MSSETLLSCIKIAPTPATQMLKYAAGLGKEAGKIVALGATLDEFVITQAARERARAIPVPRVTASLGKPDGELMEMCLLAHNISFFLLADVLQAATAGRSQVAGRGDISGVDLHGPIISHIGHSDLSHALILARLPGYLETRIVKRDARARPVLLASEGKECANPAGNSALGAGSTGVREASTWVEGNRIGDLNPGAIGKQYG